MTALTHGNHGKWFGAFSAAGMLLIAAGGLTAGCRSGTQSDGDRLPGRSRPIVVTDWPHPRDFKFAPSSFTAPDPDKALAKTTNGLRAYIISDPADTVVRMTAAVPIGRLYEGTGERGASALLLQLLTRDDPSDGERPLSLRLESLGTSLQVEEMLDATRIAIEVLPEDWHDALRILTDVLRRSRFDDGVIHAYKAGSGYSPVLAGTAGNTFRPKVELERIVAGYPVAPTDPGTPVSPEAVRALASRSLAPDQVVLGIGGHVARDDVEKALDELTTGWKTSGQRVEPATVAAQSKAEPGQQGGSPRLHTVDLTSLEGWIAIGRRIGPVPETDRAALAVAADVVNTRLNITTREIRGLSNRTSFELPDTANGAGVLLIRSGGRTEAVAPLVKFSVEELARMTKPEDTIADDELARAKGNLTLAKWQGMLDGARQASATYALELLRKGGTTELMKWPATIQAVTTAQVKTAAQNYFKPFEMATVVIGPLEKIRKARHPRWPASLDELASTAPSTW
jgi:predicted Zn-dependent peptidase